MKISLTKNKKKEDFGIQLGCKFYVKKLSLCNLVEKEINLKEGDLVLKINNASVENLSLKEIRKLIENSKEKLNLVIKRCSNGLKDELLSEFDLNKKSNLNLINGTGDNNFNDSLATRNWLNQNVYVEPPTRSENNAADKQPPPNDSLTNGNTNESLSDLNEKQRAARNRLPISEFSLNETNELDNAQPNIPNFLSSNNVAQDDHNLIMDGPLAPSYLKSQQPQSFATNGNLANGNLDSHPDNSLPRPNSGIFASPASNYNSLETRTEASSSSSNVRKNLFGKSEPRLISFRKEGNVGIRLIGGNQVGIFVTAIQPNSPAAMEGLKPGDKLLKVNNVKMKGVTREEAVLYLLSVHNQIDLLVQHCKSEYDEILLNQKGDSFYIRANFNHQPASTSSNELTIEKGDIFHVTNTLFNGVVGHWYVSKLSENREEISRGTIPNESKANAIFESKSDGAVNASASFTSKGDQSKSGSSFNSSSFVSTMKAASFFRRRRSARRTKSLGKEHWEEVMFADRTYQKLSAYQKIEYKHPGFVRPIVILGGLADFARQKLLADYPDKYALPEFVVKSGSSGSKENNLSAEASSLMAAGSSDTSHLDSLDDLERLKMMKKQREVEEDDEELQMATNQMNGLKMTDRGYQRSFNNEDDLQCDDLTKQRHQNDELKNSNLDKNFDLNCFTGSMAKGSSLKMNGGYLLSNGDMTFANGSTSNDSNAKNAGQASGGIIKLSSIKTIIDKGKHALLDIAPQAINRLNYAQLYPIVIYLKAESKSIIKELRIRHNKTNVMNLNANNSNAINASNLIQNQKSTRKIFDDCSKLEKNWSSLFTATINLTTADVWYKKLRETIEKQQLSNIWTSSATPDPRISDDFLVLPMQNNRLSYASSPDSDMDLSLGSNLNNANAPCSTSSFTSSNQPTASGLTGRLAKACSVPSIATIDDLSINQSAFPINPIKFKENIATVDPLFGHHFPPTDSSTPTSSFVQMPKTPTKHDQNKEDQHQPFYEKSSPSKMNQQPSSFGNLNTNGASTFRSGYAESNTTNSSDPSSAIPTPNQLNPMQNRNSICNNILTNGALLNKPNNFEEQTNYGSQMNGIMEPPRIDRGTKPSRFKNGILAERFYNGQEQATDQTGQPLSAALNSIQNGTQNGNHQNGYTQNSSSSASSSSTPKPSHAFINTNGYKGKQPNSMTANGLASMQDYMNASPNSKQQRRKSGTMFLESNSTTNNSSPYSSNYVSPTSTLDNRPSAMTNGSAANNANSNFNNGNQFVQNGTYLPTLHGANQMSALLNGTNGNPSINYSDNGFNNNNNSYLPMPPPPPPSMHTNGQFPNGLLSTQMDLNANQSQQPQRKLLKAPTPPPKPSHYQRTIDLPGYYPVMNGNLPPPPIPKHEPTYLPAPPQQSYLSQARRRLPYADPNAMDGLYMTATPNGLVNYQPQEIRNSYAQQQPNGMPSNLARAMQQPIQQGPYLNVPLPYSPRQNHNLMMNGNNVNLPNQGLIDLSANRDQRSSAFELYRKPPTSMSQYPTQKSNAMLNGHHQPMMPGNNYGLPPLPSPK